ncbi:MAG: hypothetical protein ACR2HX_16875, partial [Pyrinomonadaceae bacterium]
MPILNLSVRKFPLVSIVVLASLALLALACGGGGGTGPGGEAAVIKIDGSSTVFPITEAVAEEFQKEKQGRIKV